MKIYTDIARKAVNEFIAKTERQPSQFGMVGRFEPMQVGKFSLSIQASSFHYCEPRTDEGPTLDCYDEVEIAIWKDGGKLFSPLGSTCHMCDSGEVPCDGPSCMFGPVHPDFVGYTEECTKAGFSKYDTVISGATWEQVILLASVLVAVSHELSLKGHEQTMNLDAAMDSFLEL